MADKQWTMNCVLAGVKVGQLLEQNKMQEATDYLANLTSELTTRDVEYLLTRALAMQARESAG